MNLSALARNLLLLLVAIAAVAGAARPAAAQQIKLYLKDGSYQLVKNYKVEGDRVRYYSVERSQWEVVPLSLVDFDKTRNEEAKEEAQRQSILREAEKTVNNTYELPANTGYMVAPGIRLPQSEGVYAYDGTRLITLLQSQGSVERDKKRLALNIALPGPILKSRSFVTLPGPAAGPRLINQSAVFYVSLGGKEGSDVELMRLKARKNDRIVEGLEARPGAKPGESRDDIPVERSQVAPGVYKLQPLKPLQPGEYALGEVNEGRLNLDVWDFGVDGPKQVKAR
ncbi:MAG: hypothetical protein KGM47_14210 [Acidobacteriota bacterium]|nr:hypothetical protein [Acidobacteriota bacterium]